jgi:hypothetical protein
MPRIVTVDANRLKKLRRDQRAAQAPIIIIGLNYYHRLKL